LNRECFLSHCGLSEMDVLSQAVEHMQEPHNVGIKFHFELLERRFYIPFAAVRLAPTSFYDIFPRWIMVLPLKKAEKPTVSNDSIHPSFFNIE
jgi:hypothetical protein